MDILLLRNAEDQKASAEKIKKSYPYARIYRAPLFKVIFKPLTPDIVTKPLIITSKNALRALKESHIKSKQPLFILGESSSHMALKLGFKNIIFGGVNAQEMAEKIKKYSHLYPALYYLHGDVVRFDIKRYLAHKGDQDIQKIEAYALQTIERPFEALPAFLFKQKIHVLFYSLRQAMQFTKQMSDFSNIRATCISQKVADYFNNYKFDSVNYAHKPTEAAMIRHIKTQ